MLPDNDGLVADFEIAELPSRTFLLNFETGRIEEEITGKDAVKQAVYIIMSVERYSALCHNFNFGIELKNLLGKHPRIVRAKLPRVIREALMQDDRILSVQNFLIKVHKDEIYCDCDIISKEGDFKLVFNSISGEVEEINVRY